MTCLGAFDDNSGTIFVSLSIKTDFKGSTVSGCQLIPTCIFRIFLYFLNPIIFPVFSYNLDSLPIFFL